MNKFVNFIKQKINNKKGFGEIVVILILLLLGLFVLTKYVFKVDLPLGKNKVETEEVSSN